MKSNFWKRVSAAKGLYLFLLPTIILLGTFSYYPAISAVYHSFFEWNGADVNEFIGLRNYQEILRDKEFGIAFIHVFIFLGANLIKIIPSLFFAVVLFRIKNAKRQYLYRVLFVIPMIVPAMVSLLLWRYIYEPNVGLLNISLRALGLEHLTRSWLGDPKVVLFSLIFIGFPWLNTLSLLIYLAGLENISTDVLEAAEIDGIDSLRKFFYIELPLILGQVRLTLVLLVIGTLQAYWQILLLTNGGPGIASIVPGLYMFKAAFEQGRMGYATAVGMVMFVIILGLTLINSKLIKRDA